MTEEPRATGTVSPADRDGVSTRFMMIWITILTVITFVGLGIFILNVVTGKAPPPTAP